LRAIADAVLAAMRLVAVGGEGGLDAVTAVPAAIVSETRSLLGVPTAALLALEDRRARAKAVAGDARGDVPVADHAALNEVVTRRLRAHKAAPGTLGPALGLDPATAALLLLALPATAPTHVLVLGSPDAHAFDAPEPVAAAEALAAAGAAALARREVTEAQARRAEGHGALTRAAKVLHESLDLPTVLEHICTEAARILDSDHALVYRGTPHEGGAIEAASGLPPELVGYRLGPNRGLSGKVLTSDRSMLTNDYQQIPDRPDGHPFDEVRSCIAVPMRWGGELRGVLTVGYLRPFFVTEEHLVLLETFAELAALACANAAAHAGLALAARTDGLTGCLNHAALHESLRREIERSGRSAGATLSLIMLDLDDFKSVNEEHGHLVGDEVLRRAGWALRQATRPYDIQARYGGDEFALLAVEAGEAEAEEIAARAIERITAAIGDLCDGGASRATAGIAEWHQGLSPTELIANADRALLFGKQEAGRGRTVLHSSLPEWFRPGRFARRGEGRAPAETTPARPAAPAWPNAVRPTEERLRQRARQLARANALGPRLTVMTEAAQILATVVDELCQAFDAAGCTVLALSPDGTLTRAAGAELADPLIAEEALRQRRSLLERSATGSARLAVPLVVDGALWGALTVRGDRPGGLDEDDVRLAEVVAGHTGAALLAAHRHAELLAALAAARDGNGEPARP